MYREPNGSPGVYPGNNNRPVPTSYDSPHEHSWEHWVQVRELVEEEDEEDCSAEHPRGRGTAA